MQCPSCKQEVPQSRFCGNCGASLVGAQSLAPLQPMSFADNRYRVERKLGEGGKGIVFLCQDTVLGRKVAVKLIKDQEMDEDALARFQREVQAMAALVHPNVVTIFDIGREPLPQPSPVAGEGGRGGRYYLVLELMEGGDVEHLISRAPNKRLDAATAIRVTSEAARGLAHAHGHGILHRDIKPGNIWLTKEGFAKLGDFGLAYLNQGAKLTRAGMMVGTPFITTHAWLLTKVMAGQIEGPEQGPCVGCFSQARAVSRFPARKSLGRSPDTRLAVGTPPLRSGSWRNSVLHSPSRLSTPATHRSAWLAGMLCAGSATKSPSLGAPGSLVKAG